MHLIHSAILSVVYQFFGEIKFIYKNDVHIAVNLTTIFMLSDVTCTTVSLLAFI